MARKVNPTFPGRQKRLQRPAAASWACVGIDTSMSAVSLCGMGFDAVLGRMTKVRYFDKRWTTEEDDYFQRLADAASTHKLMFDVLPLGLEMNRIFIAVEEPVPLGMIGKRNMSGAWVKQQCEISGAVLGSLYRYGFENIFQINNAQWKAVIRKDGTVIRKMDEGGKWDIKDWALKAYGLPDLPDLVKSKSGSKIPRPESGYGAKAKAVQPNDIYDAAACLAWMQDHIETGGLL